ncbi:MAG: aminotransferase class I/II-fold pyridoxal phosphate-dependent enzyme [Deinococcales bacterium]
MPQYSKRLQSLKASSTVRFNSLAADMKRKNIDVIAMTAGEPDFAPPEHVQQAAHDAIKMGLSKYTDPNGTPELRKAVAAKFKRENRLDYDVSQISVSSGGKQVLYNGFMAVLEPGNEVIVPAPYWVSYPAQVQLAGGKTVSVMTYAKDSFVPSVEATSWHSLTPQNQSHRLKLSLQPNGRSLPP